MISFSVSNSELTRTDSEELAQNTIGLEMAVTADSTWDGASIVARFTDSTGIYDVLVDNGSCVVPWEVMRGMTFVVSLVGTVSSNDVITTNMIVVPLQDNESTVGETPTEPSETLYQQLDSKMDEILSALTGINRTVYSQTEPVTVANTALETSIISSGSGSTVIPAGSMDAGTTYRLKCVGYLNGLNNAETTVRIKINSVNIVASVGNIPAAMVNVPIVVEYCFTVLSTGESGSIIGGGISVLAAGSAITTSYTRGLSTLNPISVNTEIDNTIDVTYRFGTASASNSLKITNVTIERLN